jgi:hypothetical protein
MVVADVGAPVLVRAHSYGGSPTSVGIVLCALSNSTSANGWLVRWAGRFRTGTACIPRRVTSMSARVDDRATEKDRLG